MYKVDFHLHTIKSQEIGDSISWVNLENSIYQLKNNRISIFSYTDHDWFSFELFSQSKSIIKNNNLDMIVYPGVEITIKRVNGKTGHCLFIFSNNYDDEQLKKLEKIIRMNRSRSGIEINKIVNLLKDYQYIMIPHISKCDNLVYDDLKTVIDNIKYVEATVGAPLYNKFIKAIANTKIVEPIMFSDTHYWNLERYEVCNVFTSDWNQPNITKIRLEGKNE